MDDLDLMTFPKPHVADEVCFLDEKSRHLTSVVLEVYDDGSVLLAVPTRLKDGGVSLEHRCSTPFCSGPATQSWHWPSKPMGCPVISRYSPAHRGR